MAAPPLNPLPPVPEPTLERLSLYRRVLERARQDGEQRLSSGTLARRAGSSAAQVRRDLMAIHASASSSRGYGVSELLEGIGTALDGGEPVRMALVGVGRLGRAMISYFLGRRANLELTAAFDTDPELTGRVVCGCRTHPVEQLEAVVRQHGIRLGIVATPVSSAQQAADRLVAAGVTGLVNFAPGSLEVPPHVFVEQLDLTMAIEKVAYFARGASTCARSFQEGS